MVCTRSDQTYVVSLISRCMENPSMMHGHAVKHIFKYIKESIDVGLCYNRNKHIQGGALGYVDTYFARDGDKRGFLTWYTFTLLGNKVSWKASFQHVVSLSTTEAEYIGLIDTTKEAICVRGFINDICIEQ